jgi:hypothetical protein
MAELESLYGVEPMPPVSLDQVRPSLDSNRSEFSRRVVMVGTAGLALAAKLGTDMYVLDHTLPYLGYERFHATAEIATPNPTGARQFAFSFPGMSQNATAARDNALELGGGPYHDQGMQYLAPADNGLDLTELAQAYEQYEASTTEVDVQTTSLGLPLLVRTLQRREELIAERQNAQRIKFAGNMALRKPIRSLAVVCGPTGWQDIYFGETLKYIFDSFDPQGTFSEAWAVKAADRISKHREAWPSALRESLEETKSAQAIGLFRDELHMLVTTQVADYMDVLSRYINPGTKVVYVKPRNPFADTTVKVTQASQKVGLLVNQLGAQYSQQLIPGGHADINNLVKSAGFARIVAESTATRYWR